MGQQSLTEEDLQDRIDSLVERLEGAVRIIDDGAGDRNTNEWISDIRDVLVGLVPARVRP